MIVITEHPKCGRTLFRFLLRDLRIPVTATHSGSAGIRRHFSGIETLSVTTAEDFYWIENATVFFLYRNPLDVMVSFYHQIKFRVTWKSPKYPKRRPINKGMVDCRNISVFIRSMYGIEYLARFYQLWDLEENEKLRFFQFESLIQNTFETLKSICEWYGKDIEDSEIERVVENNVFKKLQEGEMLRKDIRETKRLKFRRGKINGYFDYMTEEDIKYCINVMEKYPSRFTEKYDYSM